jgi:hypothetical protein
MNPAAPPLPQPLESDCEHDWPPMWETGPGSRHRCGRGPCRVLRVNDAGVLYYYDPAGRQVGWEPVPDYMRTWYEFWVPALGSGPVDLDKVMRKLHDYAIVLTEVSQVYSALTGDRITKPNSAAYTVIEAVGERHDEAVVTVLDGLAGKLDAAGHFAAAQMARDHREDYGGDPDSTIPGPGVLFRVLGRAPFDTFFAEPGWVPAGPLCDDILAILYDTSPVQVLLRAADLPGGGEDPQRRGQALQALMQLCQDHGWRTDLRDDGVVTIISSHDADTAAAAVAAALNEAELGPVTLHDDEDGAAAGKDGIHITNGTWPVQIHIPAGPAVATDLASRLAGWQGWRAEPAEPGWIVVIPAVTR